MHISYNKNLNKISFILFIFSLFMLLFFFCMHSHALSLILYTSKFILCNNFSFTKISNLLLSHTRRKPHQHQQQQLQKQNIFMKIMLSLFLVLIYDKIYACIQMQTIRHVVVKCDFKFSVVILYNMQHENNIKKKKKNIDRKSICFS